jgi:hypothetical protein
VGLQPKRLRTTFHSHCLWTVRPQRGLRLGQPGVHAHVAVARSPCPCRGTSPSPSSRVSAPSLGRRSGWRVCLDPGGSGRRAGACRARSPERWPGGSDLRRSLPPAARDGRRSRRAGGEPTPGCPSSDGMGDGPRLILRRLLSGIMCCRYPPECLDRQDEYRRLSHSGILQPQLTAPLGRPSASEPHPSSSRQDGRHFAL